MADIKNVTIDGVNRNFKDEKARNDITDLKEDLQEYYVEVANAEINNDSLCVSDSDGNVIAVVSDKGVQTKGFNSSNKKYRVPFVYTRTSVTIEVPSFFPKGTKLAFHIANNTAVDGMVASVKVPYFYVDSDGNEQTFGEEYGYNYHEVVLEEDAYSVGIHCPSSLTATSPNNLAFCVYEIPSYPTKPTVIHIAKDGGGDFTSLRDAIESVTDSDEYNPYIFYIHRGEYDILSEYTSDEISASGFQGLYVRDGMSIIGASQQNDVVIKGTLDTSEYDVTKRNDVSLLNIIGNVLIKNITLNASNIRYCIHDDTSPASYKQVKTRLENVKFYASSMTSGSNWFSYGAGFHGLKQIYAKDCDFGTGFVAHTANSGSFSGHAYFENCSGRFFKLGDYNSGIENVAVLRNCKAQFIQIEEAYAPHEQYMTVEGEGTSGAIVWCPSDYVYNLGDCVSMRNVSISAGKAVKLSDPYGNASATSDLNNIYGISLGVSDGATVIQRCGYINSDVLGLSGLSVGDYLTVNSSGNVVGGGTASNAIAQVFLVYNNVAFAKLLI